VQDNPVVRQAALRDDLASVVPKEDVAGQEEIPLKATERPRPGSFGCTRDEGHERAIPVPDSPLDEPRRRETIEDQAEVRDAGKAVNGLNSLLQIACGATSPDQPCDPRVNPGGQRPERDADVRPDDSVARVPLDEREVPAQREHFERG
jgi:hypothetical protein